MRYEFPAADGKLAKIAWSTQLNLHLNAFYFKSCKIFDLEKYLNYWNNYYAIVFNSIEIKLFINIAYIDEDTQNLLNIMFVYSIISFPDIMKAFKSESI